MKTLEEYNSLLAVCKSEKAHPNVTHPIYDQLLCDIVRGIETDEYTIAEAKERIKIIRQLDELNLDFWYD